MISPSPSHVAAPSGSPPLPKWERGFGAQALTLAGVAARLLAWRPDEFWRATPAELASALHDEMVEPVAGDELGRLMEQFPDG